MTSNKNLQLDSIAKNVRKCRPVTLCKRVTDRIQEARVAVVNDFQGVLEEHGRLLRLAVNEAEALAWQTEYPHLLFPSLAVEKAQALEAWHVHQKALRGPREEWALAA
jgi:hypothetical protein